jgi:DNA repair protein RadC
MADQRAKRKLTPEKLERMTEDEVLTRAWGILEARARHGADTLSSPKAVRDYLSIRLATVPHEEFHCVWLDSQHRVISFEAIFRGTLTQTSVYPREVVKSALANNAAAVIFAHNHPSGVAEPSRADELLTQTLRQALALIETKVLDHFIVAGSQTLSFAERGLL